MRKLLTATDALDSIGAILIVTGVAFIYWPAAFILAGAAVLLMSWRATR